MGGESENPNGQHQNSEGGSEQRPLTAENLATHDSDSGHSPDSGSSNDDDKQDPALDYIGSQFNSDAVTTTEGNLQHDDTPMQRWRSNSDDRPPCWHLDEKKAEDKQGDGTK